MFKGLKFIIYDFDGVMTDNRALLMDDGREAVFVHRGDGLAVGAIKKMGIPQMIISTEALAPSLARSNAMASPIPRAPPVTNARLFLIPISILFSLKSVQRNDDLARAML